MARRVNLKAAAKATGLSLHELRSGARAGRYPHMRVGNPKTGRIIFDLDILENHLRKMTLDSLKTGTEPEYGVLRRVEAR